MTNFRKYRKIADKIKKERRIKKLRADHAYRMLMLKIDHMKMQGKAFDQIMKGYKVLND